MSCNIFISAPPVATTYTDATPYSFTIGGVGLGCATTTFTAFINSPAVSSTATEYYCGAGSFASGMTQTATCTAVAEGNMVNGNWNAQVVPSSGSGTTATFTVTHVGSMPSNYVAQQKKKRGLRCGAGMTSCPIGTGLVVKGYECIPDVYSNIESCGGCGSAGVDCTANWDGYGDIACIQGHCVDFSSPRENLFNVN